MTSPRSTYGGGYYAAPSFPDTPIYDSLVAERGTPQIAPIRVSSPYDGGSQLPALPALPSGPSAAPQPQAPQSGYAAPGQQYGYPAANGQQPAGLQQAPAPYIPQQAPRYAGPQQQYQQPRPAAAGPAGTGGPAGYDAMRPVAPRPAPAQYEDPYNRPYPPQQGGY
ncbi:DUF6643 family protein [Streptomyces albireticuli]|uniref:Uncharacterized protein n=1 Tax=Streptomyces albireticuli TaxID=1940 RepID=A0A2A2D7D0_9ACTN|nr:DUF6643 family protein [Streptomyces albireticuli]MCD9141323.1 hypothetical protein [Streptomyces albireticuli]MCD9160716.1 hypothetical protein [Streptomyces albireticuli]MCD9191227.1 hypothetical protein [Streptomyces albireticuli]PAU48388.1 hypothetical protein CK936_13600 [Streptomyces albireticuli]